MSGTDATFRFSCGRKPIEVYSNKLGWPTLNSRAHFGSRVRCCSHKSLQNLNHSSMCITLCLTAKNTVSGRFFGAAYLTYLFPDRSLRGWIHFAPLGKARQRLEIAKKNRGITRTSNANQPRRSLHDPKGSPPPYLGYWLVFLRGSVAFLACCAGSCLFLLKVISICPQITGFRYAI